MNIRMAVLAIALASSISVGCGASDRATTPPPASVPAPTQAAPAPAALPAPVKEPPLAGDPVALYADCETRVEGSDTPGECSADSECVAAGCSRELCLSTAEAAAGVMSTCEVRPCFSVLEACRCDAGRCRWQVGN